MAWEALGGDPVHGDPSAARSVAATFAAVEQRTAAIGQQLRSLGAGLGPHLWSGPAAEAFRETVVEILPRLQELSDAHGVATSAMNDYATALESARAAAARAESDA